MSKLMAFLGAFQMFEIPVQLKVQQEIKVRSYLSGFASLILKIAIAAYFISTLVSLLSYNQIKSSIKISKIPTTEVNGSLPMFGFKMTNISTESFFKYFQAYIKYTYYSQKEFYSYLIELELCDQSSWSSVHSQLHKGFNFSQMLCAKTNSDFILNQTLRSLYPSYVKLVVSKKTSEVVFDKTLNPQFAYNLQLYIYDERINEDKKISREPYINQNYVLRAETERGCSINIELSNYIVKTDNSIFLTKSYQYQYGNYISNIETSIFYPQFSNGTIFEVLFSMNQKFFIYEREIGKIESIFGLTGGILTTLASVLGFILYKYNCYNYQLSITNETFKQNDKNFKNQMTFIGFLKNQLNPFRQCFDKQQKDTKQKMDQVFEETNSILNIHRLMQRIQILETSMKQLCDENQYLCLKLTMPYSLKKSKRERMDSEYCSSVIKKKPKTTISDIRTMYNAWDLSLEELHQKIQKQSHLPMFSLIQTQQNFQLEDLSDLSRFKEDLNDFSKSKRSTTQQIQSVIIKSMTSQSNPQDQSHEKSNKQLKTLQEFISLFKELARLAAELTISQQNLKVEKRMAKAFSQMKVSRRMAMQQNIPIIVLHRLIKTLKEKTARKRKSFSESKQYLNEVSSEQQSGSLGRSQYSSSNDQYSEK